MRGEGEGEGEGEGPSRLRQTERKSSTSGNTIDARDAHANAVRSLWLNPGLLLVPITGVWA